MATEEPSRNDAFEDDCKDEEQDKSDRSSASAGTGRNNYSWSPSAEHKLVSMAMKHKAYKRTRRRMDDKWSDVRTELMNHREFSSCPELSWRNIRQKFDRMKKEVTSKYALEAEGANLSGLPDPSEVSAAESLMYDIVVELLKYKNEKEELEAKERSRQASMLTHEKNMIATQSKACGYMNLDLTKDSAEELNGSSNNPSAAAFTSPNYANETEPPSLSSSNSGSKSASKKRRYSNVGGYISTEDIISGLQDDPELIAVEVRERDFKIEKERQEMELRRKEKEIELDMRQKTIEVQNSMLEMTKLVVEALKNKN